MTLSTGTRLGPYEILAPLGAGGMGEVYRARDSRVDRVVALKILPEEFFEDSERRGRFEREAKLLASLNHPGIAVLYSFEEVPGSASSSSRHLLAMELVDGEGLSTLIASGPLPVEQFLSFARQIAEAVAAAQEKGVVHRDLKPANIKVAPGGRIKLLDFGLAKKSGAASVGSEDATATGALTQQGVVMGTVPYMSPEQLSGRDVDHRTDIFSLGVILYEMATGCRPFEGNSTAELASAILRDVPRPATVLRADLPPQMERILGRCLEKDSRDRYQTPRDLYNELTKVQAEASPVPSGPASKNASSAAVVGEMAAARPPAAWKRPAWEIAAVLLGLLAYLAATRSGVLRPASRAPGSGNGPQVIRSIAVLPLDNYSGDPGQEYFAEGMTDELTADLATISQLRVISRGSAMQFKGRNRPPTPEIARTLNVDAIVEGSVLRAGDRVRITAQLIDARADRHLWAKSFERSSRDVLALQDELASAIAREIHIQLTPTEQTRLTRAPTVNPEAYDAYLKGRYFFNRPSDANLQKAIAQFEEAIALDPRYAPAFSGLSDAYLWAGYNEGFLTASEARPRAEAAAKKAIELDPESAEAHTSLAVFKLFYEYDWAGCEVEFRRAFALNPSYAFARDQFGLGLSFQGRFDESIAESRRAAELDPLSPQIPIDSIFAFAWQGKYEVAKEHVKRAADLDPTFFFAPWAYGWIDLQAGKATEAIREFQKAKTMEAPAFVCAWLAYAYGISGDRARALAEVEELRKRSLRGSPTAFDMAIVRLGLGDHARALDDLEKAYASDSQWLGWLKGDRVFDPLRSEPRFVALMRKLRFEK
jgi:TolB-like protein